MDTGQRLCDRPALGIGGRFTGTNSAVPSRRVSTLLATSRRIIHTAAGTPGHSTPSHPA